MLPPLLGRQRNHASPPLLELQVIAVWNTAARIRLIENNPTWLTDLAQDIPEASRWKRTISNDPVLNAKYPDIKTGFKKFEKRPSDQQHIPKDIVQKQQSLSPLTASSPNLVRKVQNWKEWAYTDGSCHIHLGIQVIGAGFYHSDNDSFNNGQPNRTGTNNTIVRAELDAIAAAILLGHSHTATDSLSSFHQIRNTHRNQSFTISMSKAISLKYSYSLFAIHLPLFVPTRSNLMLELRATNAQMPLPNIRLFRMTTPMQTQPSHV
eukprot:1160642-Pelagomonas_calceolata.AAC.9